jgi:hypothetical protein
MIVQDLFGTTPKVGEVGIEIETEFNNGEDVRSDVPAGWSYKGDGSLRGEQAVEYVLRQPCKRNKVDLYIDRIYDFFDIVEPDESANCSVHVHINCQELDIKEMVDMASIYYILEPLLISYCGEHRKGNLFCLSGLEAEEQLFALESIKRHNPKVSRGTHKYAALNLNALREYGSLEFRAMRFPITREELRIWINMLLEIKDKAKEVSTADEVLMKFSELGPLGFVEFYLPTYGKYLDLKNQDDIEDMQSVMYRLQPVFYANEPEERVERAGDFSHNGFSQLAMLFPTSNVIQEESAARQQARFFTLGDDITKSNGNFVRSGSLGYYKTILEYCPRADMRLRIAYEDRDWGSFDDRYRAISRSYYEETLRRNEEDAMLDNDNYD